MRQGPLSSTDGEHISFDVICRGLYDPVFLRAAGLDAETKKRTIREINRLAVPSAKHEGNKKEVPKPGEKS